MTTEQPLNTTGDYEEYYSFNDTDVCLEYQQWEIQGVILLLPVAVVLVIILSFTQQRKNIKTEKCWGRPGLLIPVNFVEGRGRRWAYALVFVVMSYRVLNLFDGVYYFEPDAYSEPEFNQTFGWTKVFLTMLNVLIVCLCFYPLLACVSQRRHVIANVIGTLYMIPWIYISCTIWSHCPLVPIVDEGQYVLEDIPIILAYTGLLVCYVMDLFINVRKYFIKKRTGATHANGEIIDVAGSKYHQDTLAYMHRVLETKPPDEVLFEGVHYSPRIICTMAVSVIMIYKLALYFGIVMSNLYNMVMPLRDLVYDQLDAVDDINSSFVEAFEGISEVAVYLGVSNDPSTNDIRGVLDYAFDWVYILYSCWCVALTASTVIQLASIVLIFFNYRGNHNWQPKAFRATSPSSTLLGSMKYSGFQIAFFIYAWFLQLFVIIIILALLCYLVIVPIRDRETNFVLRALWKLWPTIIVSVLLNILQQLMCKFFFLQNRGEYLALTNRRAFFIMSYFLFFFNVILGLFSCLKRLLFSLVFGAILISRLDRLLLMQGFERFDSGYSTYVAMLRVELCQTHPILHAFVHIVLDSRKKLESVAAEKDVNKTEVEFALEKRRRVVKARWRKSLTLINNPSIVLDRINEQNKERKRRTAEEEEAGKKKFAVGHTADTLVSGFTIATIASSAAVTPEVDTLASTSL